MSLINSKKIEISLDIKSLVIALLVLVIAVLLFAWRPWASPEASDRTITATGQATQRAEPDEFIIHTTYEFKDPDFNTAFDALAKKSNEIVSHLTNELKIDKKLIKSNADNYRRYNYMTAEDGQAIQTLDIAVTFVDKNDAQKIQDYLVTTKPIGSISPQASFSDMKRKELESKAHDEATKEARAKADQSARNLGFKIGKVKSVEDGSGFGGVYPMTSKALDLDAGSAERTKLEIQPGQEEITYSVTVTYFVR